MKSLEVMQPISNSSLCFKSHARSMGSDGLPKCPKCLFLNMEHDSFATEGMDRHAQVLECQSSIVLSEEQPWGPEYCWTSSPIGICYW